ncbi:hypothetical protein QF030_000851 [Streptomyces rishiriensis]|uniref:Uncharacterized protein n=1 Tax=Streptomyces rishiriensis TaxID=68264 RepID=A0ABU0NHT3_STRRH|nr:hypothetical protein [Streptomyces rishiriensis]
MAETLTQHLVLAPLTHAILIVGRSQAAGEAVGEGFEVPTEAAPGTVDDLADDTPEIFQRSDLPAVQRMYRCQRSAGTSGSVATAPRCRPFVRKRASCFNEILARGLCGRGHDT